MCLVESRAPYTEAPAALCPPQPLPLREAQGLRSRPPTPSAFFTLPRALRPSPLAPAPPAATEERRRRRGRERKGGREAFRLAGLMAAAAPMLDWLGEPDRTQSGGGLGGQTQSMRGFSVRRPGLRPAHLRM